MVWLSQKSGKEWGCLLIPVARRKEFSGELEAWPLCVDDYVPTM